MIRKYHSLLTKPIDLFEANTLVYGAVEILEYNAGLFGWPLGICVSACFARLFIGPFAGYLDKVQWKLPKFAQPTAERFHEAVFLNDLEYDAKKLSLNSQQVDKLKQDLRPSVLVRQCFQGYLLLGFARGLSHVSLNPEYYSGINIKYFLWSLTSNDPIFLIPLLSGLTTYTLLRKSYHPFNIKISENQAFWAGFLATLLSVPLPISYIMAYSSFTVTHLLIKRLKK